MNERDREFILKDGQLTRNGVVVYKRMRIHDTKGNREYYDFFVSKYRNICGRSETTWNENDFSTYCEGIMNDCESYGLVEDVEYDYHGCVDGWN